MVQGSCQIHLLFGKEHIIPSQAAQLTYFLYIYVYCLWTRRVRIPFYAAFHSMRRHNNMSPKLT